jgi:hypothetical protein
LLESIPKSPENINPKQPGNIRRRDTLFKVLSLPPPQFFIILFFKFFFPSVVSYSVSRFSLSAHLAAVEVKALLHDGDELRVDLVSVDVEVDRQPVQLPEQQGVPLLLLEGVRRGLGGG